jgi:hypothetical protein
MANISHSTLTDPYLHEPKGVAAATTGKTYRSDGAGSGAWEKIQGWGQYQDSRTTVGSPVFNIATGVRTKYLNNGAGLTLEYLPSDSTVPLWNVTTNKHIPIAENDVYDIRTSFFAENYGGTDPYVLCELDIGGGPGVIFSQIIPLIKGGVAQPCSFSFPVFTGSTYIVNGGEIYLTYVGTGTCDIYSTTNMIHRQSRQL